MYRWNKDTGRILAMRPVLFCQAVEAGVTHC